MINPYRQIYPDCYEYFFSKINGVLLDYGFKRFAYYYILNRARDGFLIVVSGDVYSTSFKLLFGLYNMYDYYIARPLMDNLNMPEEWKFNPYISLGLLKKVGCYKERMLFGPQIDISVDQAFIRIKSMIDYYTELFLQSYFPKFSSIHDDMSCYRVLGEIEKDFCYHGLLTNEFVHTLCHKGCYKKAARRVHTKRSEYYTDFVSSMSNVEKKKLYEVAISGNKEKIDDYIETLRKESIADCTDLLKIYKM